ncbi:MAG: tol-pal system protein YbgF [Cyclobacteriaceae bacterium]|nr:tol-pal system protein YbgF [Cyclobacteriaceae bacterium]
MKYIIHVAFLLLSFSLTAQKWTGPIDSAARNLLNNRHVELEATQAMFDLYNMNFTRADRQLQYLKKQYGWHPLPYFLMGLNYWWQMLPYGEKETKWDQVFMAYMDTSEVLSKRLYKEVNEIEGAFFLAATYSFQGRFYSERGQYTKASMAGKYALKYLEECKGHSDFSPELLFGDGLFNYYAEWIPENYPMLKPFMVFFPEGDKKLGIQQLEETARNAFYARTEAQYFLMRILYSEEGDVKGAMQISEYLHSLYPNNAYFHRFYTRLLYHLGKYEDAIRESKQIIERIDLAWDGYEYNSGRYAAFFLGHISEIRHDYVQAKKYFQYAIEYAELSDATGQGFSTYAYLHLGDIAVKEENYDTAREMYEKIKKLTKRKDAINQAARKKLAELKDKK